MERPEMTKHLYETLVKLTDLARDAAAVANDGHFEGRLAAVEANATVELGQFYIDEFNENYVNGDLK